MYFKLKEQDKLHNTIKLYPYQQFQIWNCNTYYNNQSQYSGSFVNNLFNSPVGYLNLFELNVDRDFTGHSYNPRTDSGTKTLIFPFVYKGSQLIGNSAQSTSSFNGDYGFGDMITGSYNLSASIKRTYYSASATRTSITALQNTFNYYNKLSPHFQYSSSLGDKSTQVLNLISIPKIFYNQGIRKGSVSLGFYISGTQIGLLRDTYKNKNLIQVSGSNSGSVAGVVLYNEGFICLTGTWDINSQTYKFDTGIAQTPKWSLFGAGCRDGLTTSDVTPSASFELTFEGIEHQHNLTLFCEAPKGQLNYSNNPTFSDFNSSSFTPLTGSWGFIEPKQPTKNIISSSFYNYSEQFSDTTYITKINIYDQDKNLIMVSTLARPIKKKADQDFTFKVKMSF